MLQFVREIPLRILIEKASSGRRGFLFFVSAGFEKDVDPLSGMSVNLVEVDAWLEQLKVLLESTSFERFEDAVATARAFLDEQAAHVEAVVQTITFREERGFSIVSEKGLSSLLWTYPQYLEFFEQGKGLELLRVYFTWQQGSESADDYHHEGFKLLKSVQVSQFDELLKVLKTFKGTVLPSKSVLNSITVHSLRQNIKLII